VLLDGGVLAADGRLQDVAQLYLHKLSELQYKPAV
jgi:hypothetical protein